MHVLAAVVLCIWIVVFVQTIVNILAVPRLDRGAQPNALPFVSIVVPARNEERTIDRAVRAFLAQDYGSFEVIVVNDRSIDRTGEILRTIADRRLTIVDGIEPPAEWLGKPWALQQGSEAAKGEVLLFVDADLVYAPETLRAAIADLEQSGVAMLALFPRMEMRTFAEHVAMPMLAFFAFSGMPLWRVNRSSSPRFALGGGSGNIIRRAALESIGGFQPLRDAVVDDVGLARVAREAHLTTRIVRADDLIRVRMYHSAHEIAAGFTKNAFPALGRSYAMAALMLALMAVLHVFPYAFLWIPTIVLISLTRLVLFRSLRYPLLNAIFLHPLMVAFWAYIFLRSIWFTGVRNEVHWRGRTYNASVI
ncbi:MAG TPA: glycosyltransferase [Thermoanaerobaculia bacterium]|nr:glycosyltransferase [Thermoanaerobaculia bacterium]